MNSEELKRIEVFQALDSDALTRLAAVLVEETYEDGQVISAEGDPGDSMYFILTGRVRIEKRARTDSAVEKTLAVLEAGDYLGEMALLEAMPRSASALAEDGATVLRLSRAAFDQIHQESSLTGMRVLFAMLCTSSERIRRLSTHVIVYDEVGKAIGEARGFQALLDVILGQLSAATHADWALLLLRTQGSERLELRGQVNLALTSAQSEAVCAGQGFLGPILRHPHDHLVASIGEEEPYRSCERLGFESASLLLCPITLEGRLLGLMVLGGQERGQFDLNALHLARSVSRQAAQAILNARYRDEEEARSRQSQQTGQP
jgi:transcriptional regulator with GAF, ATPase, and Fis domain